MKHFVCNFFYIHRACLQCCFVFILFLASPATKALHCGFGGSAEEVMAEIFVS